MLGDAVVTCIAGVLLAWGLSAARAGNFALENWQVAGMLFVVFAQLLWGNVLGAYNTEKVFKRSYILARFPLSILASFCLLLIVAVASKVAGDYSRLWFFSWFGLTLLSLQLMRLAFFVIVDRWLLKGHCVFKAFAIGIQCDPLRLSTVLLNTERQVRVVYGTRLERMEDIVRLSDPIAEGRIDRVYISTPWERLPQVLAHVDLLRHLSTEVLIVPEHPLDARLVDVTDYGGGRLSFCAMREPIRGWNSWLKHKVDVCGAGLGLALLAPLLVLVALAIRLETRGPVLFRQTRTGFNGRTFELLKFRSMYTDLTDSHAEVQTSREDPRVTRIGRFIRRTSIDELPQLLNVLKGEMSLIGPRPHALATTAEGRNLEELVEHYAVRHRVKPGLTGLAQVNGYRGELDSVEKLRKRVDFDLEYIEKHTFWLDLKILVRTFMLLLHDTNAY